MEHLLFALLVVTSIGASLAVIASRNPVYSAMYMVVVFIATAIMFLLLQAPFMAALQIIVYAGAIVVLFLFVISFLSVRGEVLFEQRRGPLLVAAGVAILLAGELALAVTSLGGMPALSRAATAIPTGGAGPAFGSVESVAVLLFTDYLVPFEVTSVLLIVAMVGAVVLARRVTDPAGSPGAGAAADGTSDAVANTAEETS